MKRPAKCKPVVDYWFQFYMVDHCTLCGNSGVIDTRDTRTGAGIRVGRLNWCICPNGQAIRDQIGGTGPKPKQLTS